MKNTKQVTPLAGVWVEIDSRNDNGWFGEVTPLAGVWVEITRNLQRLAHLKSLPSRECGLKSDILEPVIRKKVVTPLAGVWVEIVSSIELHKTL